MLQMVEERQCHSAVDPSTGQRIITLCLKLAFRKFKQNCTRQFLKFHQREFENQ